VFARFFVFVDAEVVSLIVFRLPEWWLISLRVIAEFLNPLNLIGNVGSPQFAADEKS
jgi:hypothetical protein